MAADSVAPHLYSRLVLELTQAVGGDEAARGGLASSLLDAESLLRLLAGGMDLTWWDDTRTSAVEDRSAVVARVLDRIDALEIRQPWGHEHRVLFQHPLARVPIVGRWLGQAWSRGPYPLGGDSTTLNAAYWIRHEPFAVVAAPAARFVVDVGNWDATVLVLPVGQSGRPWSPHYSDQLGAWLHVEPVPLPYSPAAVDAAAKARLVLVPAASD
jgi:penicillin amidase